MCRRRLPAPCGRARLVSVGLALFLVGVPVGRAPAEPDEAATLQRIETEAARRCFERNLDAIRQRDREVYLSTYWQSESLARTGWGGIALGYEEHAANSGDGGWPDVFDAQRLQLVWLRPGVVYGSYRYRVTYGRNESRGISERLFLKTEDGWRIAVTTAFGAPEGTPPPPMALVGATLVDIVTGDAVSPAHVVVRSGRIDCAGAADSCAVPAGVTVVDATGLWVLPGLIDTGVYLSRSAWVDTSPSLVDVRLDFPFATSQAWLQRRASRHLRAALDCGITTALDRGGFPWTFACREVQDATQARLFTVGPVLTTRASLPSLPSLPASQQSIMVRSAAEAADVLRYLQEFHSDAVVFQGDDTPEGTPDAVLTAIAAEAHRAGLVLCVETSSMSTARAAVEAGARLLIDTGDNVVAPDLLQAAHQAGTLYTASPGRWRHELEFLDAVLEARLPVFDDPRAVIDSTTMAHWRRTPRLTLADDDRKRLLAHREDTRQRLQRLRQNVRAAHDAGIPLVLGTGAGAPFTAHGASVFGEMEELQACGVPAVAVLRAATWHASKLLPAWRDRGVVRAGNVADLVLVPSDPRQDLGTLRRQVAVMRGGELRWTPAAWEQRGARP